MINILIEIFFLYIQLFYFDCKEYPFALRLLYITSKRKFVVREWSLFSLYYSKTEVRLEICNYSWYNTRLGKGKNYGLINVEKYKNNVQWYSAGWIPIV